MNFPIFRNDFDFSLEEIYRYLKCYHHHLVYISTPRSQYHQDDMTAVSVHEFQHDGLVIRLFWKVRQPNTFRPCHLSMGELTKRHKNKEFSLLTFTISEFSKPFKKFLETPDEECRNLFENFVLKGRGVRPYSEEEYRVMELEASPTSLPDIFFEWLIQYNQNRIDFEKYYDTYKRQKSEQAPEQQNPIERHRQKKE